MDKIILFVLVLLSLFAFGAVSLTMVAGNDFDMMNGGFGNNRGGNFCPMGNDDNGYAMHEECEEHMEEHCSDMSYEECEEMHEECEEYMPYHCEH